jgi:hypothetical protein
VPKIISNTNLINENQSFAEDVDSKKNILKGYNARVKQMKSKTKDVLGLGSNFSTTANIYNEINTLVPKTVRFTSFGIEDKKKIIILGVAKDDQSVIQMMNNFSALNSVKEAKIETIVELSDKDRIELYTVKGKPRPKLEELPKETISKKFTVSLTLSEVDGEKFDNDKILAKLIKGTKKK